jgi:NAD(P)-dependent dehydrogenase (short-subunit alcohol dehydrogenase family)
MTTQGNPLYYHPTPRAVLITGAARRIGRALALSFAQAGWDIVLHYRSSLGDANATKAEIEQTGRKCHLLQADLSDPTQAERLIAQAFAAMPHLSVLINNASDFPAATLNETDAALLQEMTNLHLHSPVLLSKYFAQHYPQAHIIMMADSGISTTRPGHFAYLLSKQALTQAVRMLARALAPEARVNAICPGLILPDVNGNPEELTQRAKTLPLQATATPHDIAEIALFLASQRAITGQLLFVDGGEHLL